jgi:hypothetical protein
MDKAILFSGPMVRAILDGRKTMTRRVIKPQPNTSAKFHHVDFMGTAVFTDGTCARLRYLPNDMLCIRETWAETCDEYGSPIIVYRADNAAYYIDEKQILAPCTTNWSLNNYPACGKWRSPIFLPKWAWRIKNPVISVRAERVQEITEEDAKAEGAELACRVNDDHWFFNGETPNPDKPFSYQDGFGYIWNSINGKKHPWESNPFVWVIEFRRIIPSGITG